MAEAIVVALISKIGDAIIDQVVTYSRSSENIPSQMADIKRELELIRAYLRYADMHNNNQVMDTWARLVREIAFDIEDLVDEYTFTVGLIVQDSGFRGFVYNTLNVFKIHKRLSGIVARLRDVDSSLSRLSKVKETYQISLPADEPSSSIDLQDVSRQFAETAHFMEGDEIIGRDEKKKQLADWLMDKEPKLRLFAIWGMEGVGKTTLTTNAYKSPEVSRHFILRAWVSVSKSCPVNDLLRRITRELHREKSEALPQNLSLMDYRDLVEMLRELLQQKRYLIILDDISETSVWLQIRHALVDNNCGSRIVITTHHKNVASIADDGKQMEVKPLNNDDARRLFCDIAFRRLRGVQYPRKLIQDLAWKIADKCEGLPLALVCMGNHVAQWGQLSSQDMGDRLASLLQEYKGLVPEESYDLKSVHTILDQSISFLPYYLRSCFLYCGAFPRGHVIKRTTLIRMWVSAGLIEERIGSTMEEVAEKYFNQLVGRCLFQVVKSKPNAVIESVKVHDLVHDVVVKRSRKEALYEVHEGSSTRWQATQLVRHLSIVEGESNSQPLRKIKLPQLRSLHIFTSSPFDLSGFRFKLLRILNLEGAPLEGLPHDVVYLFNLRFLSIRGTEVSKLPKAIGNLRNLETLDAMRSQIRFIPKGITKIQNLRHLMASTFLEQSSGYGRTYKAVRVPKGKWNLRNLLTLKCVIADKFLDNMESMKQIRTLEAIAMTKTACSKLCKSISSMSNLLNLTIYSFTRPRFRDRTAPSWITAQIKKSNSNFLKHPIRTFRLGWRRIKIATKLKFRLVPGKLPLKEVNSRPTSQLQKLNLSGTLENGDLPTWLNSLVNLTCLSLRSSRLQHDSIIQLNKLTKLAKLQLHAAYEGGILCIPPAWLPCLKTFVLEKMFRLKTIKIGDNALRGLENMYLMSCKKLKTIPVGIRNLTSLEKLVLDDVPSELVLEIRYYGDEIKHIPRIEHWYQKDGTWKQELLSQNPRETSEQSQERIRTSTGGQSADNSERPVQEETKTTTGKQTAEMNKQ